VLGKPECSGQTEILIDSSGAYYEVSSGDGVQSARGDNKLHQAQISLNDCLACRCAFLFAHGLTKSLRDTVTVDV
jgi:hypothetical protein